MTRIIWEFFLILGLVVAGLLIMIILANHWGGGQ